MKLDQFLTWTDRHTDTQTVVAKNNTRFVRHTCSCRRASNTFHGFLLSSHSDPLTELKQRYCRSIGYADLCGTYSSHVMPHRAAAYVADAAVAAELVVRVPHLFDTCLPS